MKYNKDPMRNYLRIITERYKSFRQNDPDPYCELNLSEKFEIFPVNYSSFSYFNNELSILKNSIIYQIENVILAVLAPDFKKLESGFNLIINEDTTFFFPRRIYLAIENKILENKLKNTYNNNIIVGGRYISTKHCCEEKLLNYNEKIIFNKFIQDCLSMNYEEQRLWK